jgi:GMP synthase-like glutamine amidotransferase
MRVHCLHHTTFEGTANVERWATRRGHLVSHSFMSENPSLPEHDEYDLLVVFGGPMGAYEERKHPWLKTEKFFLEQALIQDKGILGICLGAQLLADVAGGRAYRGHSEEVGWFPVTLTETGKESNLARGFPEVFHPLHWHGDTFELPFGSRHLARSDCYPNQMFDLGERVLGIQFHLDLTFEDLKQIVRYQRFSKQGPFFQSRAEVVAQKERFTSCLFLLHHLLDVMEEAVAGAADSRPTTQAEVKRPKAARRR